MLSYIRDLAVQWGSLREPDQVLDKPGVYGADGKLTHAIMGTSSSNFEDKSLDAETEAVLRLVKLVFGGLTPGEMITLERHIGVRPAQMTNVRKTVLSAPSEMRTLRKTLTSYRRANGVHHHITDRLFTRLCYLAGQVGHIDLASTERIILIGARMGMNRDRTVAILQNHRIVR